MEALAEKMKEFDLKDWFKSKYSTQELEAFYLRCVISSQSVHDIFLALLADGQDISKVSVAMVVGTLRVIHSENTKDNK